MIAKIPKNKTEFINYLAYALIIFFIIFFIILSIGRHQALKSFQNDLGTYSQLTWNTLHGHFFEASGVFPAIIIISSNQTLENFNYLSAHFSPILLFFVPFYAVWADPQIFLILQAIAVGLGSLPIYWLAKEKISNFGGLIFLISYLLYPIIHNSLLYDFHEVTFAVPLVTFFLWFWYKNKIGWMIFFLGLLLLVQEHVALIIFMFGLYLAFIGKRRKLGLLIAIISLAYFFLIVLVVMPRFSSSGDLTLLHKGFFTTRYEWLGTSFGEIINTIIKNPFWVLKNALGARQLYFLITLLLPVLGLSLYSGLFILALPIIGINFLSNYAMTYSIYFYHSAILVGIIYFAAIFSFAKLIVGQKRQKIFLIILLISSLIVSYIFSVTPLSAEYTWQDYRSSANAQLLNEVKSIIPPAAAISVQHNLGPHFSLRRKLFHFPFNLDKSDYVIVDVFDPYRSNPKSFFGFDNVCEIGCDLWAISIDRMFNYKDFGVIYNRDGWLVFKRGASLELNATAKKDFEKNLGKLLIKIN